MYISGGCHCGAITFIGEADPKRVAICHCTDCQKMSGGPYRSMVQVAESELTFQSGEPKIYPKIGDSGNPRELGFCESCGAHIYATSPRSSDTAERWLGIRTGLLDQVADLPPQAQVWFDSAVPWAQNIADLPRKSGQ